MCFQGLRDPEELMLGSFTYPNLQQEGEHFKVVVKHMCTPNEVATLYIINYIHNSCCRIKKCL